MAVTVLEDGLIERTKLTAYLSRLGAQLAEQRADRWVFSLPNNQSLVVTGHDADRYRVQRLEVPCAC